MPSKDKHANVRGYLSVMALRLTNHYDRVYSDIFYSKTARSPYSKVKRLTIPGNFAVTPSKRVPSRYKCDNQVE